SMTWRRTLTLTLSFLERERGSFACTASGTANRDPRRVRSSSPLPARSGERIKVRGPSDCIIAAEESIPCAFRLFGKPRDDARPAFVGDVGVGPLQEHREPVAEADQENQVNEQPGDPGQETVEFDPTDFRH